MDECLKKSSEGRKFGVALGTMEYSGDLATKMLEFSAKLEVVFKKMQELRSSGNKDLPEYAKYFRILDEKFAWFKKAEACETISKFVTVL